MSSSRLVLSSYERHTKGSTRRKSARKDIETASGKTYVCTETSGIDFLAFSGIITAQARGFPRQRNIRGNIDSLILKVAMPDVWHLAKIALRLWNFLEPSFGISKYPAPLKRLRRGKCRLPTAEIERSHDDVSSENACSSTFDRRFVFESTSFHSTMLFAPWKLDTKLWIFVLLSLQVSHERCYLIENVKQ